MDPFIEHFFMNGRFYKAPIDRYAAGSAPANHPWFQQFLGKTPSELRGVLQAQWQDLKLPPLQAVARKLLSCTPLGILDTPEWNEQTLLVLSLFPRNDLDAEQFKEWMSWAGEYFLPPPPDVPSWLMAEVAHNDCLQQFIAVFGGLRDRPPPSSGDFCNMPMGPIDILLGDEDPFLQSGWTDSHAVYHNDTDDELLVHSSGKVGWLTHDGRDVVPKADSFGAVLMEFAENGRIGGPYD